MTKQLIPEKQRDFAVDVVRRLREAGFEAYWAGGCVRDHLLCRTPYDYDVATNAHPEQIRGVFKHRKTLSIGAAFGVMTVVGPRGAGQVEVTTFRQDVSYSDGRHPDQIAFTSPEEDAKRRDFTINGMFYDPLAEQIIDFVGGEADLRQGVVRAIGDARQRFTEDKLRMLRAVRFTSIFNFGLEDNTLAAIREMASQITVVSAERIADEMRIVLVHPARVAAVNLLQATGLLRAILPEAAAIAEFPLPLEEGRCEGASAWQQTLLMLGALDGPTFPLSLATLLQCATESQLAETIGQRWRLSRKESDRLAWLLENRKSLVGAAGKRWSQLQPLLADEGAAELIQLHATQAAVGLADPRDVEFCRGQLARPKEELDPPQLITGADLISLGIAPGPAFARLLREVRVAQLDGRVGDRKSALALIEQIRGE